MTNYPPYTRTGALIFAHWVDMSMRWHALTLAQRRVLCDLGTATPQPLTRLCELGYVRAVPRQRTASGEALFRWAVRFKGVAK